MFSLYDTEKQGESKRKKKDEICERRKNKHKNIITKTITSWLRYNAILLIYICVPKTATNE